MAVLLGAGEALAVGHYGDIMVIDPLTFPTMDLPAIWAFEKAPDEDTQIMLNAQQTQAELLRVADPIEVMIRLMLSETQVERIYEEPEGYDPDQQGEWDKSIPTFAFSRRVYIYEEKRSEELLDLLYVVDAKGFYRVLLDGNGISITKEKDL